MCTVSISVLSFFYRVCSRAPLSTYKRGNREGERERKMNRCIFFVLCLARYSFYKRRKEITLKTDYRMKFSDSIRGKISNFAIFLFRISPSASSSGSNHIDCNSKFVFFSVYFYKCSVISLFRSCSIDVIALNKHTEILINCLAANTKSNFYCKSYDFSELHT